MRGTPLETQENAELGRDRDLDLSDAYEDGRRDERSLLKSKIDILFNNYLCEMKPDYDDSIYGFNEAWDIIRKVFAEAGGVKHVHVAGTTIGKHIDECAVCGHDIRHPIHSSQ